jgi:hypothetical protein
MQPPKIKECMHIKLPDDWPEDNQTRVRAIPSFGLVAVHPDRPAISYDFDQKIWVTIGKVTFKDVTPTREDKNDE